MRSTVTDRFVEPCNIPGHAKAPLVLRLVQQQVWCSWPYNCHQCVTRAAWKQEVLQLQKNVDFLGMCWGEMTLRWPSWFLAEAGHLWHLSPDLQLQFPGPCRLCLGTQGLAHGDAHRVKVFVVDQVEDGTCNDMSTDAVSAWQFNGIQYYFIYLCVSFFGWATGWLLQLHGKRSRKDCGRMEHFLKQRWIAFQDFWCKRQLV